ncbi:M23 family metallopeptidase [Stappia sp. WLB 29]|uniref:murein hydrolase activator EnvC family protein n=1 Tax=Stappia sp. WLB 29 TaxID=2925220 RepID=UPI0020C104A1|nr:M23 family metallopeptidase [Stappia sp. WLB 29]
MTTQVLRPSSRLLTQTAVVIVLAALAGACSGGVERFEDPIFTGNTDNQRAMLGSGSQPSFDSVAAGPRQSTGAVQRSTLPPPTGANQQVSTGSIGSARTSTPATSGTYAGVPAATSAPRAVSAPTAPSGEVRNVRGWTTAGATQVTARQGDTVASLSRRYGIPQHVLGEINGTDANGSFTAGQRVTIPTYSQGAPNIASAAPAQPTTRLPAAGGSPSVTGSIPAGAGLAGAPRPQAKPGAQVRVASLTTPQPGRGVVTSPKSKPAALSSRPTQPAASAPTTPARPAVVRDEPAPTAPIAVSRETSPEPAATGERRFRWPARGRIISEFGPKPGGAHNDGINLALPEGTEIKAVEDGTVIYSGNELKGFGNLVLVRHDDGWVSAYAHNSSLLVKRGDGVQRGQTIAKAGSSGSVSQPQLHFELRRGNKPVDPMKYLASL